MYPCYDIEVQTLEMYLWIAIISLGVCIDMGKNYGTYRLTAAKI